jgi:hypothetical protein
MVSGRGLPQSKTLARDFRPNPSPNRHFAASMAFVGSLRRCTRRYSSQRDEFHHAENRAPRKRVRNPPG